MGIILQHKNEIIAIVIIAFFVFIGKGMYERYTIQMQELASAEQELLRGKQLFQDWDAAVEEYKNAGKGFFRQDVAELKSFVEDAALNCGVNISYVGPARDDRGFYWDTKMDLQVDATYKNVMDFLQVIEKKKIGIEKLVIRNSGESDQKDIRVLLKVAVIKD